VERYEEAAGAANLPARAPLRLRAQAAQLGPEPPARLRPGQTPSRRGRAGQEL